MVLEFGLLGPVEVRHLGQVVPLGGPRSKYVLATLLLNAGKPIRSDVLVDALWPDPPPTARAQLHNLISKLRGVLRRGADDLIGSRPAGYELRLDPHWLDLEAFRQSAARGRLEAVGGRHPEAVVELAGALALWRGPAMADVADDLAVGVRQALHDERLAVVEAKLRSELALGRVADVLRDLPVVLADHPFHEGLWEIRITALALTGQRADALADYQRMRHAFAVDLGIEPGPALRDLELRVLRGEPPAPVRVPPRQLPLPLGGLTGRDDLLAAVRHALTGGEDLASRPVLLVGRGGVGKTALALTAAHRSAGAFPDGQLHADLGGRDPATPHVVAGRLLRALGVDGGDLPEDTDERLALYRTTLAGKRVLLVLDDAGSEAQVRPLLPGEPTCRVLVTSRRRLGALVGALRLEVPVLAISAARALFADVVGPKRVAVETTAAHAIVAACSNLPLAVVVAAGRLAVHPHWRLEEFLGALSAERGRLDALSVGDLDVRASIALSFQALDPPRQRLLRLLGLLDGPDWPAWVTDALAKPGSGWTTSMLDQFTDLHLVETLGVDGVGQQRYRLHDLVAEFARERAHADDPPRERAAAVSRVLSGWLALAAIADDNIPHGVFRTAAAADPPPAAAGVAHDSPYDWFEAERTRLIAAIGQARRCGEPDLAGGLALRLSGFLWLRSYDDEWERELRLSVDHVRDHGSPVLLAQVLGALFDVCAQRDRLAELPAIAADHLAAARASGDDTLVVRALRQAGMAELRLGRIAAATVSLAAALERARGADVPREVLRDCLDGLAWSHREAGALDSAVPLLEEALAPAAVNEPSLRAEMRRYHLALVLTGLGRTAEAADLLDRALRACQDMGDELGVAHAEQALADVDIRDGRVRLAARRLADSVAVHERFGGGDGLAEALRSTGDLAVVEGRWSDAVPVLDRAVGIWRRTRARIEVARTLARLERVHAVLGESAAAEDRVRERTTILAELGLGVECLLLPPVEVEEFDGLDKTIDDSRACAR